MPGQLQPGRGASRAARAAEAALKPADPLVRSLGVNGSSESLLSIKPVNAELDVRQARDAEPVDVELDFEQAEDVEQVDIELDFEQAGDAADCKICRASASLPSSLCAG